MNRDTKIGLALGILLIGTVAAFCFRNQPIQQKTKNSLELANAKNVNALLESRTIKPYLNDSQTSADPAHEHDSEFVAHFNNHAFPTQKEILYTGNQPPPNAIPIHEKIAVSKSKPVTTQSRQPQETVAKTKMMSQEAASVHVHKIQPGDTLSGLAIKYLGSVARADDIFKANQETLKSPDQLKIGMELKIPTSVQLAKKQETLKQLPPTNRIAKKETP